MRLADLTGPAQINVELESHDKAGVLGELAQLLAAGSSGVNAEDFLAVLQEREKLRSTGVGSGVAIPHGKLAVLHEVVLAVGLSHRGIDFDAVDGLPVNIFIAMVSPLSSAGKHLKVLARVARLGADETFRRRLLESKTPEEAYQVLVEEDQKHSQT